MKELPRSLIQITAVVMKSLFHDVVDALQQSGIDNIYTTAARNTLFESEHEFHLFRLTSQRALTSDAVEILKIIVAPEHEESLMALICDAARLDFPGMGSVYSQDIKLLKANPRLEEQRDLSLHDTYGANLSAELIGISCTVVKGQGNELARVVLETAASVPTITYGVGTGLRDKLGLLRITIPAEKETLNFMVSRYDAAHVFERLIQEGKLDRPGRGFINLFPIRRGKNNTRLTHGRSGQAASMDQMISAIDDLKGNIAWRRSGQIMDETEKSASFAGLDMTLLTAEAKGYDLVQKLMAAGVPGSTVTKLKLIERNSGSGISRARVACNMLVTEEVLDQAVSILDEADAFGDEIHSVVMTSEVPKAFTYRRNS